MRIISKGECIATAWAPGLSETAFKILAAKIDEELLRAKKLGEERGLRIAAHQQVPTNI